MKKCSDGKKGSPISSSGTVEQGEIAKKIASLLLTLSDMKDEEIQSVLLWTRSPDENNPDHPEAANLRMQTMGKLCTKFLEMTQLAKEASSELERERQKKTPF
jgi:hypothetical protein